MTDYFRLHEEDLLYFMHFLWVLQQHREANIFSASSSHRSVYVTGLRGAVSKQCLLKKKEKPKKVKPLTRNWFHAWMQPLRQKHREL